MSKAYIFSDDILSALEDLNLSNNQVISFKEWKNQGDKFYERILEEDKQAVSLFNSYTNKMLAE